MSLAPGTRLGSYHVTGLLGEGGMGAVYRARDAKLNRDVALKVLLPEVASDPERLARFRREAQTLAALNHPHIGAIYGLEESNGTIALVLELVEGPTLADRIAQGPIPPDEALAIAKQIADALEAAHEQGIVHRDLKPANVKVRDDGTVKVLDFGLAKALGQGPGIGDQGTGHAAESLTITSPAMTMRGVILGTAAYMSPEQAKGKPVDKRADIWAFGVVLYEMCTGRRAFDGETLTDVIAAVVTREPDWAALSAAMPPRVRALLRRCLKKESRARLRDIGEARVLLDDLAAGTAEDIATATPARATWRTAAVVASTAIAVVAALGITVWRSAEPPPREVLRFSITPAVDASLAVETNHNDVAFSPDGERVAYFSVVGGARQLVVRPLDRFEPVVVDGVPETVRSVSFASDGLSLMFQAGQGSGAALFKVPVSGGTPSRLAPLSNNLRGATTLADSIVFATIARQSGLMQVPASGGEVETLTTPSAGDGELDHLWPSALPGGRHLLFSILRERTQFDVAILTLETRRWRVLIPNATSARYSSSGHIVFGERGVLKAVPFDLQRLELNGDIVQVVDGVVTKPSGAVNYSISETGSLVYMPGRDRTPGQRLDWVRTADGQIEPTPLAPANFTTIRVSPDGRSAAAVVTLEDPNSTPFLGMGHELWLIDLQRGVTSSLVREPGGLSFPEWSPDGRRVAYYRHPPADATGSGGLFVIPTSGTEASVRATTAPAGVQHLPGSWTRDGQAILFTATDRVDASEIMQVSLATGTVSPVIAGATSAAAPALSPDGRWLAYREMPFARGQTFIRSFPRVGDLRIPVSADRFSGLSPISWAPDGGRLYYPRNLSPEQGSGPPEFRSVVVTAAAGSLSIGTPTDLLPQLLNTGLALPPIDGRLLRLRVAVDAPATEYRVILNWMEELKRLAPPK